MAAYSMDLRTRVLRDSDAGMVSKDVAAKYAVSRVWVDRVKQRRRETGEVAPRTQTKFRRRALDERQEYRLVALITTQPDATLAELQAALTTTAGLSALWRAVERLGFRVNKTVHAAEQRRPDVAGRPPPLADQPGLPDRARLRLSR